MKCIQVIKRILFSSPRRLLTLLLITFAGLGLTYALETPCFESPDEWSHLSVIRYWIEHQTPPPRVLAPRDEPTAWDETWYFEYHDPPLYYAPPLYHGLAALLTSWTRMDDLPRLLLPSPSWERGWAPQSNSDPWNKNIYAHRAEETLAQSDTVRAAALLRTLSLGLAAVTVWCAYELAHILWPDRPYVALGAAAFVAFNPQFIALSIGVTNDNLLNALFALSLVYMLRFMRDGANWPRWAALGGLMGLALLTKQSALLLLPMGLLAAIWQPKNGHRTSNVGHWAFLIAALGVGVWWYARNWVLYRDPLGLETHFTSQLSLTRFGLDEIVAILRSYWAAFGWAPLLVEPPAYAVAGLVMLAALVGVVAAIRPAVSPPWGGLREGARGLAFLTLAFGLNAVSFARWAIATGVLSGRLMFATLPVVAVLVAWGLAQWSRWKVGRWTLGAAAALALLFAAIVPLRYLRPAYGSPRLPAGMPGTAQAVDLTFQGNVQLAGYEAMNDLEPGEEINLTLYWRAPTAPQHRYRVWAQLGPQDAAQKVAEYDTWLGGTLYPSDLWQAGDTVRQTARLTVPDWTSAPGLYWMRIGLVDDDTGERVSLADGSSDMAVLGPWRARAASPPPAPACAADFRLGSAIRLAGYDLEMQENNLSVTLYWQAEQVPDADYTVYAHLLDEEGNLLGQHDGPPRDGAYPTSWWLPGDAVTDQHSIPCGASCQLAPLHLQVGMYDPATLVRLPVYDDTGRRMVEDSVPLKKQACHAPRGSNDG